MRLSILLALVATGFALVCNVGNVVLEDGIITSKFLRSQPCSGMCSRVVLSTASKNFIMLSCQENEVSIWRFQTEGRSACSATEWDTSCLCGDNFCSDWIAEENLKPISTASDPTTQPICYAGYYANNGTNAVLNTGVTTTCTAGQACAFLSGVIGNTMLEIYLCTTINVCLAAIGDKDGTGTIPADNVQMTCCTQADCTGIVTNPNIYVPQTVTQGNNNITCNQGAQLDYGNLGNFLSLPCSGSCSSVSLKTYVGSGRSRQVRLLDLYTCDPVAVCDAVNLNNACGNLVLNATDSLLRGCCCNTNNCIDPTQQPPVFPTKQLKCYTGIYVPSTGYSFGAEMFCSGKCGRIDVFVGDVNSQIIVKYMGCFPYSICQGFGIENGDQSYNPPMEEETTVTCCSSNDNCNISPYDLSQISYNVSVIPTTNYPILCYGNIHLNGVPMTTGSYSMCNGECAMAFFSTVVYGTQHNTTIYTCDPATMCKAAGITNGCTTIDGTGVTTCCCDDDTCFDPNRVARTSTNCYTGIYINEDNYLNGGETLCDGWCASLSTIVNNKNVTTYWCAPVRVCRSLALGMGGDQNCQTIPNANTPLTGCCCAEGNNCNLPTNLLPNVTSTPVRREPPIICYEAIHINGVAEGNPDYRVCNGNCVSMTMGAKLNGSVQSTTLYTCDSSASCNAMGLRNGCGSVDGTVYSCCCDSDACIDPNFNRSPDRNLNCYVGVNSPMVFAGTMVQCNGKCANITTNIGNIPFSTYLCVPNSFCSAVALDNACDVLQLDRALTGCCCDSSDGCNALGANLTTAIPVSPPETPIACYSGLNINDQNWTAGSGWSTCMGNCMVLSINSSFNGQYMTASMYTCDPTTICTSLNMTNRCHQLEPGVEGCCCSDSACIDPTKNPPKFPRGRPLTCYNGVVSGYNNLSAGAEQSCDGSCASLSSMVNGVNFTVFSCVPKQICSQLSLYDNCQTIQADRAITGCCCDNADNCNIFGYHVPPPAPREHDFPIVCFQGIYLNNKGISIAGWQTCMGDCALVSFNTTVNGANMQADWYTCDPAAVCHQLNVFNRCHQVEPGISGCCCETDACLDPTRYPAKKPGPPLKCYVGVKSVRGLKTNIDVGAETFCDGMCGNIHGLVGAYNVSTYFCAPMNLCKSLELNNDQKQLSGDRFITAYCCDLGDNCNVRDPAINTTRPVSPPEYPVSCYSGVFVNGMRVSDGGWMSCNGDCALLSMNSTFTNGTSVTAELYTCDPTSVCRGLNLTNSCATVEDGLMGCCCDSNGCLDPTRMPPKRPGQLYCYAGIQSDMANVSTGAAVACSGKCGSLNGNLAGYNVSIFACVDSAVCRGLNLYDDCTNIPGDREVRACCCDNYSYCNTRRHNITSIPTPNPNTEFPISCWNGLRLNGQDISPGRWQVCNGDCASIQMNTTINGTPHSLSLYTCDPATVCSQLNLTNTCGSPEPGITGCCCDSDACIDPNYNRYPGRVITCYVGVWNGATNQSMGVDSLCDGKCASIYTYINNHKYKAYFCLNQKQAETLNVDNGCRRIPADREVEACVCDDSNNCNVRPGENVLQNPLNTSYSENPIACWNGLYINGNAQGSVGWNGCKGNCAAAQWQTSLNVNNHTLTFYTCDPAAACSAMGLVNSCGQVDAIPGLTGCCCSSDACMDATSIYPKNQNLNCYAGIVTPWSSAPGGIMAGASVKCSGRCASLSSTLNGFNFTAYQCISTNICQTLGIDGNSDTLTADRDITGYCCSTGDYCNIAGTNITPPKPPIFSEPPISCYSGLWVNGNAAAVGGYIGCQGKCASISLTTNLMGDNQTATLYTCDPATVCSQLNLTNTCGSPEPGITGCCCDSDACIDPNYNRYPGRVITCYVGVWNGATNQSMGVDALCDGKCASIYTYVNNHKYKAYFCLNQKQAEALSVHNGCIEIPADREVEACVCDYANNCNVKPGENVLQNPLNTSYSENPIACWNGLYINGNAQGSVGWNGCKGNCAAAQWQTSLNGNNYTLTFYTCDPAAACSAMGLVNSCGQVDAIPGLTGCCCSSDACMDANSIYPKNQNLNCYAGIVTPWSSAPGGIMAGAAVECSGRCASLSSTLNGYNFTAYQCISNNICQTLGIDETCGTLTADRDITGCCCSTGNYCNIAGKNISVPIPSIPRQAIACYSGLWLNGAAVAKGRYTACQGYCASISITTSLNGAVQIATLYTCDPATVCSQLNIENSCSSLEPGIKGCCCDYDTCIDPIHNIYPGNSLSCYVGAWNAATNGSVGAYTICTGKCASVSTSQNGKTVKGYFCVNSRQAEWLGINNGCKTIPGDRSYNICVCDTSDNCNVAPTDTPTPTSLNVTATAPPITCWSGTYVNGNSLGWSGWVACTGNCVSLQLNTTVSGIGYSTVLYTCDVVSTCQAFDVNNNCLQNVPGFIGCCCDQNACMTVDSIYPKLTNTTNNNSTTPILDTTLTCYAGIVSGYSANPGGIMTGAPVKCYGKCGTLASVVNGYNVTIYQCMPTNVCEFLGLDNSCSSLPEDPVVAACCCSSMDYCNIAGTGISPPRFPNYTEPAIACYNGLWLDGIPITADQYSVCQGKCSSIGITSLINGQEHVAVLYTCDPTTFCNQLNITNNCAVPEPGIRGCCCDSDTCIDPQYNREPGRSLFCYVGVWNGATRQSMGADSSCDGKCASVYTYYMNNKYKAYFCLSKQQTETLGVDNGCRQVAGDQTLVACVCDGANNCNVDVGETQNPLNITFVGNPIACWNGLYVNGFAQGSVGWSGCRGMCSSMQWLTTFNGIINTFTLYTCDPAAVCSAMGLINSCGQVDAIPGLTGCCCSSDACMDANSIYPKNQNLNCYAGIVTPWSSAPGGIMAGASVKCSGRCASLSSTLNGYNFTAYQCISNNVCQTLGIDGACSTLYADRDITGCCCSSGDYCSTAGTNITFSPPTFSEPTIACYSGLWVNGNVVADGGYIGCQGKCASISLTTTLNGAPQTATLFTCDPAKVCSQLNFTNSCGSPEPGVKGCCCDSDACIDPNYNRSPDRSLSCYIGAWNSANNRSVGAFTTCDGKCASISTYQSNSLNKVYFCLNAQQTESLEVDNGCRHIPSDKLIEVCICDDSNNCNIKPGETPTNTVNTNYTSPPITCWSGTYINGQKQGSVGWVACTGNCASIQMNTTFQGAINSLVLYTCDPSAVCSSLSLNNTCRNLDAIPGLIGCCCDRNACMTSDSIYPTVSNSTHIPAADNNTCTSTTTMNCFAGIVTPWSSNQNGIMAGASMKCNGRCGLLSSTVNGFPITAYQCIDTSVCQNLSIDNTCHTLTTDRDITGCCCSNKDYCNIDGTGIPVPSPSSFNEPAIACYSGLWVNGNATADGGYTVCQGKCVSISITTYFSGKLTTATLYTCDPATVCSQLNVSNSCISPETGILGCCCDTNTCIDPNFNRYPGRGLTCYVGVWNGATKQSMGADTQCDGKCASIYTYISNQKYKAYFCLNQEQTEALGVDNGCRSIPAEMEIKACVCDSANNCNVDPGENVLQNPINTNFSGNPIACWSGLYINDRPQGEEGWSSCKGMCASLQWLTSLNGAIHVLKLYTCDPSAACSAMGLNNNCGQLDGIPGLTGCCCGSDACMDSTSIYPKNQNLNCFVGMVTPWSTAPGGIMAGAAVKCSGRCLSLTSTLNGNWFTAYQCIPTSMCQSLGIDGLCYKLTTDPDIAGCCCSTKDFCNIDGTGIVPPAISNYTEPSISCYNGLWVNGNATADGGYVSCQGKCASISITTSLSGQPITATLYSCDPATVCAQLSLMNSCGDPEPGVRGCCCDSDACIDPNFNRSPGRVLQCYVGAWNAATNESVGDYTTCDGKCASVSTYQNGKKAKAYFCLNIQQTESLGVDNGCRTIPADRSVEACVCDDKDNCNIKPGETPDRNAVNITYDAPPITCWSGAYVNNVKQGQVGWVACTGNCASIQLNTTYNGVASSLVLYTCDPAAACKAIGLSNSCNTVDGIPNLMGCCCDQNACMTSVSIYPVKSSEPTTPKPSFLSTVGTTTAASPTTVKSTLKAITVKIVTTTTVSSSVLSVTTSFALAVSLILRL